MGLIYAKNLKHAKRKLTKYKSLTSVEKKKYVVKRSPLISEEKGYHLYNVTKK